MINDFITGLFVFASLFGFGQQSFGAFSDPFLSVQLAASPTNGDCLTTDGTNNSWDTCGAGPGGGLTSYDAWTHPASGISATTSDMVFNSASSTFVGQLRAGHFFGDITGRSSTTLALSANGANCSSGNSPLGIDTAGAVESCFDVWTEAENTSANYEQSLTAGDGLTRTIDDFDCDIASGSIFGCLSTTDWTTFNSKLGTYDAWTHPASGQSATTSLVFFAGFVSTASSTINGNLNILGNATATNATTTTLYNSGQTRLGALSSSLVLSGSTGILSNYTGIGCTNQVVEDVSAAGAGTCVSINNGYWSGTDLSVANGGTGLSTFGGTNHILYTSAADTLVSEAAFTYDQAVNLFSADRATFTQATTTNLYASGSTTLSNFTFLRATGTAATTTAFSVTHAAISTTLTLFGTAYTTLSTLGNALVNAVTAVTPTGTWDFGGATSVEIPNGTAPTVDAAGELALDTTNGQLVFFSAGAAQAISATTTKSFNISSTTVDALGYRFNIGTTTFLLLNNSAPMTLVGWYCTASTTGTALIRFIDASGNATNEASCTSGAFTAATTNNTWTEFEAFNLQASSTVGTVSRISITAFFKETRQ